MTTDDSKQLHGHAIHVKPSFWQELKVTLVNPLFLTITFGWVCVCVGCESGPCLSAEWSHESHLPVHRYAGFTAVVAGLGSFGPTFVQVLYSYNYRKV